MATKTTKKKASSTKKKAASKKKNANVESVPSMKELFEDATHCCVQEEQEKSDTPKTFLQKIRDWFLG